MDDDSTQQGLVKWGLGLLGVGAIVTAVTVPTVGLWIALAIVLLALLLFGGYYLWLRRRARRQREQFTSAIEAQTSAVPKSISDPNQRAALDRLRQRFQSGLQEFKSRGKDIYKLPWYVIIGESGSGKSEAIRHSGIDFAHGMQDEFQGSGGTVNMDWWFTNRGIILDTAGSMIFSETRAGEAPEWREFLRLLKKSRPHSPINGLFLVLSVESLIRDSSEKITQKASLLAQQLELIQRTLDVRFPVYLLVTKCDLLTGFREFFDNIDDPLLQHQIFGWSNPEPLDAAFRPELVEQHLNVVAERVRRRRLALLREVSLAPRAGDTAHFYASSIQPGQGMAAGRRLDEVDSMYALSESILRLAPRLRRYFETIFVAGEFSPKPVFLRGVYFTSSMREGKALDEAIAYATGLSLDRLPEDRSWDKNRAFFLRDLFHEKVFRESGLVTRATSTLRLLRQRKMAIFGTAAAALLVLLVFAAFAFGSLKKSVLKEASFWKAGAANWNQGAWTPIVNPAGFTHFAYAGTNPVPHMDWLDLIQYHAQLAQIAEKPLTISWIFKPMAWINLGAVKDRARAQRLLFEASVLQPLVSNTRFKMTQGDPPYGDEARTRYRDALVALIDLEADARAADKTTLTDSNKAAGYLTSFLAYLTDTNQSSDPDMAATFAGIYSKAAEEKNGGVWPPKYLRGSDILSSNAIGAGLEKLQQANLLAQTNIERNLDMVDDFEEKLAAYQKKESAWLASTNDPCQSKANNLDPAKKSLDDSWNALANSTNLPAPALTSLSSRYNFLKESAANASVSALLNVHLYLIRSRLPKADQTSGLFPQIIAKLNEFKGQAAKSATESLSSRLDAITLLDTNCLAPSATNSTIPAYLARWQLYEDACSLDSQLGFPVVFDSTRTMNMSEFLGARKLLATLSTELRNPAWQSYPVVAVLQKNREAYESIVSALVNDQGTPAGWELWFVPPDRSNKKDYLMLEIFRYLKLDAGKNPIESDDLTRASVPVKLAEFNTDQGLSVAFQRYVSDTVPSGGLNLPDWALVRLIQYYKASREEDSGIWRFKIPLQDDKTRQSGNFTFEIRLIDSKHVLPKIEDWPVERH